MKSLLQIHGMLICHDVFRTSCTTCCPTSLRQVEAVEFVLVPTAVGQRRHLLLVITSSNLHRTSRHVGFDILQLIRNCSPRGMVQSISQSELS